MPCPSSECLVMTKSVRQHKIVKGVKLQRSESCLVCVVTAEGSTNALPLSTSIPAHFCIPVSLYNKNVLLRCLINDILWLVIEFFYLVVIVVWCWGVWRDNITIGTWNARTPRAAGKLQELNIVHAYKYCGPYLIYIFIHLFIFVVSGICSKLRLILRYVQEYIERNKARDTF